MGCSRSAARWFGVAVAVAVCGFVPTTAFAAAECGSPTVESIDLKKTAPYVAGDLKASVLLPAGYDPDKTYPVLYLLHGKDENHQVWPEPTRGDIATIARERCFPGIIVMPDQRDGFSLDWFNEGQGGTPAYMSHWSERLIPFVEDEYSVREGRRWHAIAGVSMGGYGAMVLAAQRPDYFGSVAALSAPLDVQGPEVPLVLAAVLGDYGKMLGPREGAYATAHNPIETMDNLQHTRVFVRVGDGVTDGSVDVGEFDPIGRAFLLALGGPLEAYLRTLNDRFAERARREGLPVDFAVRPGTHDYPTFRRLLREALAWDVFGSEKGAMKSWTYRTARPRGRAWHVDYEFDGAPEVGGALGAVAVFRYDAGKLSGEGDGRVTVRSARCAFTATLPFEPRSCPASDR